ncbi:GDP-fucose protein O-fucosyltransferase 1 [Galendromus occidentalis]|uniref:GDP-fucose protein O-fucosyltransferase 1 n=1 Tax=Galendromus occidentalis TaxID=34638 RepID=A0AAJ6VYH7_9ACAR|nr:GDP-fucose protein O-fucosyltransferase 1 [Galendromus occidentalis]
MLVPAATSFAGIESNSGAPRTRSRRCDGLKMVLVILWIYSHVSQAAQSADVIQPADPHGYIAFCPCMGRFGNQADQYIGALAFAKSIDRTLILPPWIEYPSGGTGPRFVPFDEYFNVSGILDYHRAITMEAFMQDLAHRVWPPEKRFSFCFRSRVDHVDCAAKDGKPFGPFWDNFGINFVKSEIFGPLHYDTHSNRSLIHEWTNAYPVDEYPVLAFTGAPGAFPVQRHNLPLQRYFIFSDRTKERAKDFVFSMRDQHAGPFVGIHLRNGADWANACRLVKDAPLLFSAPQCFGYRGEQVKASDAMRTRMCLPDQRDVLNEVTAVVRTHAANWVFVASDHDHLLPELQHRLRELHVEVVRYPRNEPHIDLAILSMSNHFIGNCFSSFSAFVKRHRDVHGLQSSFWLLDAAKNDRSRDEL